MCCVSGILEKNGNRLPAFLSASDKAGLEYFDHFFGFGNINMRKAVTEASALAGSNILFMGVFSIRVNKKIFLICHFNACQTRNLKSARAGGVYRFSVCRFSPRAF